MGETKALLTPRNTSSEIGAIKPYRTVVLFYFHVTIYVTNWLHIMRRDVFQAIADPHRRAILELLARQPLTVNGLAEHFAISRPAVSKHIKILKQCGLVVVQQQGREHYCQARPERLNELLAWVTHYQQLWEQRLDRLDEYLNQLQNKETIT